MRFQNYPVVTSTTALPSTGQVSGQLAYNSTNNTLNVWNGTAWVDLGATGGGASNYAYSTTIGDGSTTAYTVTHNLGSTDVAVTVREAATPFRIVDATVAAATTNTVTVTFANAPATNAYRVTVLSGGGVAAPAAHASTHLSGGSDALTGNLDATARHNISKAGTTTGTRRGINFIEGGNVTLTMADDSANERVNVTIASVPGTLTTVRKTADQTNATVTNANVTDLVFPVTIGADHSFEFWVMYTSSATTTGVGFAVTVPALNVNGYIAYTVEINGRVNEPAIGTAPTATNMQIVGLGTASDDTVGSDAVAAINTVYTARIWGVLSDPSATTGGIQLRHRSETAVTTTVKKGSWGRMHVN